MVQTAVSQATRVAGTNRRLSVSERIDELVRVIGIDTALRALREVALLERKPIPVRFVDEPAKRLREVEAALDEQRTLLARAKIR